MEFIFITQNVAKVFGERTYRCLLKRDVTSRRHVKNAIISNDTSWYSDQKAPFRIDIVNLINNFRRRRFVRDVKTSACVRLAKSAESITTVAENVIKPNLDSILHKDLGPHAYSS